MARLRAQLAEARAYTRTAASILRRADQRRYLGAWLRSLRPDYCLNHAVPWLPFPVIRFLDQIELSGKLVFEYGSGGSTLYWLKRGARCVSVEHDQAWYARVRGLTAQTSRLDYRLVVGEVTPLASMPRSPADPLAYASADANAMQLSFRAYASQIDGFPDAAFDLILIDGRARPSCLAHCVPKIRDGGHILLDNADRDYYLSETGHLLERFELESVIGHAPGAIAVTTTHIYRRVC